MYVKLCHGPSLLSFQHNAVASGALLTVLMINCGIVNGFRALIPESPIAISIVSVGSRQYIFLGFLAITGSSSLAATAFSSSLASSVVLGFSLSGLVVTSTCSGFVSSSPASNTGDWSSLGASSLGLFRLCLFFSV